MTRLNSTCQNPMDMAGHLRNFICGYRPHTFDRTTDFSGVGGGDLNTFGADNTTAAAETWTITCTDATTEGAEVWSVVGSVAGSISTTYVSNTLFDTSGVNFIIVSNATAAFAVSDAFTVVVSGTGLMTTSGEAATLRQHEYTAAEYIFGAEFPGIGGFAVSVIVGGQNGVNARMSFKGTPEWEAVGGDIYNHSLVNSIKKYTYTIDSSLEYWITAGYQGFNLVVKSGTYYRHATIRYGIPFGNPAQYPYPIVVAAESYIESYDGGRVADGQLSFYVDPAFHAMEVMTGTNTWIDVWNYGGTSFSRITTTNNRTTPYNGIRISGADAFEAVQPNLSGDYLLMPVGVRQRVGEAAFLDPNLNCILVLELEGVAAVADQNVQASENIIQYAGDDWLVFQNIDKTGNDNFMALKWV